MCIALSHLYLLTCPHGIQLSHMITEYLAQITYREKKVYLSAWTYNPHPQSADPLSPGLWWVPDANRVPGVW